MKKFYKIVGTIAGITAAVGIICCIIGAVMGANAVIVYSKENGFHILDEQEIMKYENMDMEAFSSINVDVDVAKVRIVESTEAGRYGVKCQLAGSEEVTKCEVENGILNISTSENAVQFSLNIFNFFSDIKNEIIIYVPEKANIDNINITSDVGEVEIDNVTGAKSLVLNADVGDIEINGGEYGTVKIDTNVGDINATISVTNKLDVYSDVGDVELDGHFACDVKVETNVGDIDMKTDLDSSQYNYDISASAGDVEAFGREEDGGGTIIGNSEGKYNMHITTDLGDVDVN